MIRGLLLAVVPVGLMCGQTFEVASIRPNRSGEQPSQRVLAGGRFTVTNGTLKYMIQFAWNVPDFQISGGPPWVSSVGYDVIAKPEVPLNPNVDNVGSFRAMLRALLAERFHLTIDHVTKEMPVYALAIGKDGPKLAVKEQPANPTDVRLSGGRGLMAGRNIVMPVVAQSLSIVVGKPVKNETGLTGYYDFRLEWTPEDAADQSGPSIFTAIQEQLGLRLEARKAPVEVLVIDHAEVPSEN
jgi:uncharacterized protein (TIGR03435 family)